jgi:ParB-like chromosome segregation protein Spo0J
MKKPSIRTVDIGAVKAYWRNPRNSINAVDQVKKSIERFGYNSFITVDPDMTIITGHTRHKALSELGHEKIKVIVLDLDPQKAKEYRIIDNKTGEIANWTEDLMPELREIDDLDFMDEFFTQDLKLMLDTSTGSEGFSEITQEQIERVQDRLDNQYGERGEAYNDSVYGVICPDCGHEFDVKGQIK